MWYRTTGTFRYGPTTRRAVLLVDQGIADFYRALIPKYIPHSAQMYPAHVSVVRHFQPPDMTRWGEHEGEQVEIEYESIIRNDNTYFWLDVRSEILMRFRVELGLDPYPPWRNRYHITIANSKGFKDVPSNFE